MEGNGLSEKIPEEIGDAKQLTTILLSKNRLSGSIPRSALNLENLEVLDVSMNRLSGEIPPHKADIPASAFDGNDAFRVFSNEE